MYNLFICAQPKHPCSVQWLCGPVCQVTETCCCDSLPTLPSEWALASSWAGKPSLQARAYLRCGFPLVLDGNVKRSDEGEEGKSTRNSRSHALCDRDRVIKSYRKFHLLLATHCNLRRSIGCFLRSYIHFYKKFLLTSLHSSQIKFSFQDDFFVSHWSGGEEVKNGVANEYILFKMRIQDFPGGTVVKNPPANAGDTGSSPGPGRSHMPHSN